VVSTGNQHLLAHGLENRPTRRISFAPSRTERIFNKDIETKINVTFLKVKNKNN
jgi:hypothetical protein